MRDGQQIRDVSLKARKKTEREMIWEWILIICGLALVITDVATGVARKFPVAPRERYNFDGSEPRWHGSRYLAFSPERLGFIDIDRLKLSFFLEQDSKLDSIEFEPTFTWAVVADESQLKIAAITIR